MNFKNQEKLFMHVWNTRKHVSEISGKNLDTVPDFLFFNCFMHILSKGKYPKFKLSEKNIMLGTPLEHHLIDFGTEKERKEYEKENNCSFAVFYDKKEQLKIEDRIK